MNGNYFNYIFNYNLSIFFLLFVIDCICWNIGKYYQYVHIFKDKIFYYII